MKPTDAIGQKKKRKKYIVVLSRNQNKMTELCHQSVKATQVNVQQPEVWEEGQFVMCKSNPAHHR